MDVNRGAIGRDGGHRFGALVGEDHCSRTADQQATVFVMHHFEQLSRNQVSRGFPGISPEAVSTSFSGNIC